ncbi:MAG: hypothetical protein JST11_18780 [Acidobacteria bacterium]|nr:hypothetical protein [Acidobacteriota bacterium]
MSSLWLWLAMGAAWAQPAQQTQPAQTQPAPQAQPAPKARPGVACKIDGGDAVTWAAERGFAFDTEKSEGSGSCSMLDQTALVASADTGKGVSCRIRFFASRKLANGWKLKDATLAGAPYTYQQEPSWPSDRPEIAIVVKLEAGKQVSILVADIVLEREAGNCKKWQEAFQ